MDQRATGGVGILVRLLLSRRGLALCVEASGEMATPAPQDRLRSGAAEGTGQPPGDRNRAKAALYHRQHRNPHGGPGQSAPIRDGRPLLVVGPGHSKLSPLAPGPNHPATLGRYPLSGPGLCEIMHIHPPPQHVDSPGPTAGGLARRSWPVRTGGMQDRGYELPRIPLLGTWVNNRLL
jgi:hypothetical protein